MKKITFFLFFASIFSLSIKSNAQSVPNCGMDCLGILDIVDVYYYGPDEEYIVEFNTPEEMFLNPDVRIKHLTGCGSPIIVSSNNNTCTAKIQTPEQLVMFSIKDNRLFTWDWELVISEREPFTNCEYHYHITVNAKDMTK